MIVAEIQVTASVGLARGFVHTIRFDTTEAASKVFHEVADLLRRRAARANGLPALVEIEGTANRISLPLDNVQSIAWSDYAVANEHAAGVRETFSHLFGE